MQRGILALTVLVGAFGMTGCFDDGSSTGTSNQSGSWSVSSYVQTAQPAAALDPAEYQRLNAEIAAGVVEEASIAAQLRAARPQWAHIQVTDIDQFVSTGCIDVNAAADQLVGRLGTVDLAAAPALTQGIFLMMRRCGAGGGYNPQAVDAIASRLNAYMFQGEQARAAAPAPAPQASVAAQPPGVKALFDGVCAGLQAGGTAAAANRWRSGAAGFGATMAIAAAASACPAILDAIL